MKYVNYYSSPVGKITMISDGKMIERIFVDGQKYVRVNGVLKRQKLPVFDVLTSWFDDYFKGNVPSMKVPLKMVGTEFQKRVWEELLNVPYGKTTTYGQIAINLGLGKNYSRAVASATGHNPFLIIVPCHRVIGQDGKLTGFAAGLEVKERLLKIEGK